MGEYFWEERRDNLQKTRTKKIGTRNVRQWSRVDSMLKDITKLTATKY